jgi:hypothetical protein
MLSHVSLLRFQVSISVTQVFFYVPQPGGPVVPLRLNPSPKPDMVGFKNNFKLIL